MECPLPWYMCVDTPMRYPRTRPRFTHLFNRRNIFRLLSCRLKQLPNPLRDYHRKAFRLRTSARHCNLKPTIKRLHSHHPPRSLRVAPKRSHNLRRTLSLLSQTRRRSRSLRARIRHLRQSDPSSAQKSSCNLHPLLGRDLAMSHRILWM